MPSTDIRLMVDALVTDRAGYPPNEWLADQRETGKSWPTIAADLTELTGGVVNLNWSTLMRRHKETT